MKYPKNIKNVFRRYDLRLEVPGRQAREVSLDRLLQNVADSLVAGDEEEIEKVVRKVLQTKDPMEVINKGLIPGMQEVGRLWDEGVYFLPQVILSSDAMIVGIALCEEIMGRPVEKKGKVVTHTVEGDIHDIGQTIVNALLRSSGFEVIDLGADVMVEEVIKACKIHRPLFVTGTALMTTTMSAFPRIAAKLIQSNLNIPLICGGGAVTEEFVTSFDLGIWGKEANQAPAMAEDTLKGLGWMEIRAKWNG